MDNREFVRKGGQFRSPGGSSQWMAPFSSGLCLIRGSQTPSAPCLWPSSLLWQGQWVFCTGFIWWPHEWFPRDFFCSQFISNRPVQRGVRDMWILERGYITGFTGLRMARLALDQSPVGFSLKAWVSQTFSLDFYSRKSIYYNWGSCSCQALYRAP